jgi:TolB protein
MRFRLPIIVVSILAVMCSGSFSQTDIYLRTERAGYGKIPIVVKPIEPASPTLEGTARYVSRVLRKDLEYSGIFDPLAFAGASDTLDGGGTAAAIFEGLLVSSGERFTLETKLLDFASREVIFSKRYSFTDRARRTVAHHICDEIVYFLVGEQGIATTRLLFCRKGGEHKDLYLIDYDGHGERQITKGELTISPVWLSAKRFCYTSYRRGNPDCYLVDLERGKRSILSHRKGLNMASSYFPEGDEIAITLSVKGNSEIYAIDSSGEIIRRLTRNRAIDCSATWSPNGRELAFVSDRTGAPQVYIMDRFGGNVRRLSGKGSYNTSPTWSPDGDIITYVSRESARYALKLISPDGLTEETIFDDYLSYEDPSWAPNGRHIATTVRYGGKPWVVIVDVDTGEKRRLVQGEAPAWSPLEGTATGQ